MSVPESILRRVQKCLDLASDSRGDPNTAAIALRQAQKLMAEHGISETTLQAATIDEARLVSKFAATKVKPYENSLIWAVADSFGCKVLWTRAYPYGWFTLVGEKHRVEVAAYTFTVLQRQLVKARAAFVATMPFSQPKQKTIQADGFCVGWVHTIRATVAKFADPDGKHAAAVKAYLDLRNPNMKTVPVQTRKLGAMGYGAGELAAKGVSLSHGVNGAASNLRIGG